MPPSVSPATPRPFEVAPSPGGGKTFSDANRFLGEQRLLSDAAAIGATPFVNAPAGITVTADDIPQPPLAAAGGQAQTILTPGQSYGLIGFSGFPTNVFVTGTAAGQEVVTVGDFTTAGFSNNFANGGDTIRVTGLASEFAISVSGNQVTLTSAANETSIALPVGFNDTTIVFETAPGVFTDSRILHFVTDGADADLNPDLFLGGQRVMPDVAAIGVTPLGNAPAGIVVTADEVPQAPLAAAASQAQTILTPGQSYGLIGFSGFPTNVFVTGTAAGQEVVTVGDFTTAGFSNNFANGGDTIRVTGLASEFAISVSGNQVTLTSTANETSIALPVGFNDTTIIFETAPNVFTDSRILHFVADGGDADLNPDLFLGGQRVMPDVAAIDILAFA